MLTEISLFLMKHGCATKFFKCFMIAQEDFNGRNWKLEILMNLLLENRFYREICTAALKFHHHKGKHLKCAFSFSMIFRWFEKSVHK